MLKELIENSDLEFFIQDVESYMERYKDIYVNIEGYIKKEKCNGEDAEFDLTKANIGDYLKELSLGMLKLSFENKYTVDSEENIVYIYSAMPNEKGIYRQIAMFIFNENVDLTCKMIVDKTEINLYNITKKENNYFVSNKFNSSVDVRDLVEDVICELDEFCMNIVDLIK